jgi:flagellar biosynthetic protein FliR
MPQMNVFFLSLPLKILVGLLALVLSIEYLAPVTKRVFEIMFEYFEQIIDQGG